MDNQFENVNTTPSQPPLGGAQTQNPAAQQDTVPLAQDTVPPAQGEVPPAQDAVPPAQGEVPPAQDAVPPAQSAVPPAQGAVPPAQGAVPPAMPYPPYPPYYMQQPGQAPYGSYPQVPKKKKKLSTGLIVFLCILGACLLFGMCVLAFTLHNQANVFKSDEGSEDSYSFEMPFDENYDSLDDNAFKPGVDSGKNDLKLQTKKPEGKAMSAAEIAKMSQNSVVGVSVYSTNGVLVGEGSGVIAGMNSDKDKTFIITCAHVIDDKKDYVYKIVDANAKEYLAAVVGFDARYDIAVLSVKKTGFDAVTFGDSSALSAGETVVAIGNPGGSEFFGSVTQGIVSATDRMLSVENQTISCIQHDAAINPGSSGGALFNVYGQVIGINYSKVALDDYEGMNFSVPSKDAVRIANGIIAKGVKTYGAKLGIEFYVAASYFDENYKQLIIGSIDKNSDLYGKAEEGDFIIAVNGEKITDKYTIIKIINEMEAGEEITLTIAHKNESSGEYDTKDVTVKLISK
ncbi:MAG: trypsin-like peptidase domain-containing protein [Clostridia bacterium]|nr:trypsin-like peptidase domain-containing protein [Clostridia bacterium]